MIFTSAGKVVYKTKTYNQDWGASIANRLLPPGTYYYMLEVPAFTEPINGFIIVTIRKMKKSRYIYGMLMMGVIFTSCQINAQNLPIAADIVFNPYELNDAYLGQQERSQIMLSGNRQWSNIEGSPQDFNLYYEKHPNTTR